MVAVESLVMDWPVRKLHRKHFLWMTPHKECVISCNAQDLGRMKATVAV